ncbi:MAG: hypothetical protein H7Y05_00290 [Steroidobacteraceae bacterium]|nr:hypothetical protein [Deltaproteobacteria bacterium]
MNRIAFVPVIILCNVMYANAETFTWTDDAGVVSFTDDSTRIPPKYRSKATKGEDITIRNPKVQQELKEQEDRARQDEINRPRIVPTPDYVPPPMQLPAVEPAKPASDELSPGRPKSQRIRENIERRDAEEKAKQLDEKR